MAGRPGSPLGIGPTDVYIAAYFESIAINRNFLTELLMEREFVNFTAIASETSPNTFEILDGRDLGSINSYFCNVNDTTITFFNNNFFVTSNRAVQFGTECVNIGDLALGSQSEPVTFENMSTRDGAFFGSEFTFLAASCDEFGPVARIDASADPNIRAQLVNLWGRIGQAVPAGSRFRFWDRRNELN